MKWHERAAVDLIRVQMVDEYTVRVYPNRIAIQSKKEDPISWETLQHVKNVVLGEVFAVEVFPAKEVEVVNLKNTRHLWYSPEIDSIQSVIKHPEFGN